MLRIPLSDKELRAPETAVSGALRALKLAAVVASRSDARGVRCAQTARMGWWCA